MIRIEKTECCGIEAALRGMRNPMNSWDRADSRFDVDAQDCTIGSNDRELALKLAKAGSTHAKYRRMIVVYADITAPLYWWKEFDTYRAGVEKNSCSTMHKVMEHEFTREDFSCEHLTEGSTYVLEDLLEHLNDYRNVWMRYDDVKDVLTNGIKEKKDVWWQIIQLLPSSYNQKRTVMMSYEALAGMYRDRKEHKLDEWRVFCEWIKGLPYSELITIE